MNTYDKEKESKNWCRNHLLEIVSFMVFAFGILMIIYGIIGCITSYYYNKAHIDKSMYIVLNYENGRVAHDIIASSVRDDKERRQVVCECAETGEVYIFSYPVSITDVTYTKDYIEWSKSQH